MNNYSASVKQRLLNKSKIDNRPFNELLQYYAMERFLYRLSQSPYFHHFILKGALMLRAWQVVDFRPTMDIDMLGITSNEEVKIVAQIRDILSLEIKADGLDFDLSSIESERITEDADYQGIRLKFKVKLGSAIIHMQIDIGFGDIIYPKAVEVNFPSLLDLPAPRLLCYSLESAIAEKFQAMVKRGVLNSRIKDFYDIWLLSRQFDFEGQKLTEAIRLTFETRSTEIQDEIVAFSKEFIELKQGQWVIFRNRLQQEHLPILFSELVLAIELFINPIILALTLNASIPEKWNAPGPWR